MDYHSRSIIKAIVARFGLADFMDLSLFLFSHFIFQFLMIFFFVLLLSAKDNRRATSFEAPLRRVNVAEMCFFKIIINRKPSKTR